MLTLQILDEGETFLVPLDPKRALVVGAGSDADVRLRAPGVASAHAKISPILQSGGEVGFKIVDLDSAGHTLVNGEAILQARLEIGDRLEIGGAVLVVGTQVRRPATAADVLQNRPRARRGATASGGSKWMVALVLLLVGGGVTAAVLWSDGADVPPAELARVEDLRQTGDFDAARELLERVQRGWATGAESRAELIDQEFAAVAAVEQAVVAGRARILAEAPSLGYAGLHDDLTEREKASPSRAEREAARILRRELRELTAGTRREAPPTPEGPLAGGPPEGSRGAVNANAGAIESTESTAELDQVLAAVDAQVADGAFAQAMETARSGMGSLDTAGAERLRERMDALRRRIRGEIAVLVGDADRLADSGDLAGAVAHLEAQAWRFPAQGELGQLAAELGARKVELARRNAPAPPPQAGAMARGSGAANDEEPRLDAAGLAGLQQVLRSIRDHELEGNHREVARLCVQASEQVGTADPAFARRLAGKAADFTALDQMGEVLGGFVAQRLQQGELPVAGPDGGPAAITAVAPGGVRLRTGRGEDMVTWLDLPPSALADLAAGARPGGAVWMGVGVHAYRHGDRVAAEAALRKALDKDPTLAAGIHGVIQRGRGDPPDERGYQLQGGEFVAVRDVQARDRADKLQRNLASRLRRGDLQAAAELIRELEVEGPEAHDALVLALRGQRAKMVADLERLPVRKALSQLEQLRANLDEARTHARDLIYDEDRYFYPFRPPQVTSERAAQYWEVQREIDDRVAALRQVWEGKAPMVRLPKDLGDKLAAVEWVDRQLLTLGSNVSAEERDALEWMHSLPRSGELTLQTYARSGAERELYDQWAAIEAFNETQLREVSDGARRQFEITNGYRRMFGHRPLAVNLKMFRAAEGHSREMSTLGYFSHFSPTEGRRTPYERMRLENYNYGVSENIAQNGSALGAHNAWLHSSGHHRNLLNPNHTEFGVGVVGRYYTQNFGRGTEYLAALVR